MYYMLMKVSFLNKFCFVEGHLSDTQLLISMAKHKHTNNILNLLKGIFVCYSACQIKDFKIAKSIRSFA